MFNIICQSASRRTWANLSSRGTHTQATWAQPASSPPPSWRAARTLDWSRFPSWGGIPGRLSERLKVSYDCQPGFVVVKCLSHTHWNLCLSSLSQWTTWWSGPSRGCSATWAHPTPSTGRREAPSTLVTEEPAAPMQPSKSTTCTKLGRGVPPPHNNHFCIDLCLQASQDQGEHNSLFQKCCQACKFLKGVKMQIQFVFPFSFCKAFVTPGYLVVWSDLQSFYFLNISLKKQHENSFEELNLEWLCSFEDVFVSHLKSHYY